ncbi:MAG: Gfo/Idh/MocA family oxidoreductase [Bryobacteraceae bacterium]|nr:Gfo/Idh/MocA family oxidoreductase [Bryobacteraceae bacterium]MCX7605019.1 Gfo/Idh/MocA family oxidoreductase [Bryobacteraceae bacterium]
MAMRVAMIGGGMIAHDQLLPSLYQLQRLGRIGEIEVCARRRETLEALAEAPLLRRAFPGQSFRMRLEPYEEVIASLPAHSLVVMALPDQLHYDAVMCALRHDQHVLAVKPLVLKLEHARHIEEEARARGLLVGVEYHKRFDDRSLLARRRYREGLFGEFRLGTACLLEKWYYRHSNFQNWFTCDATDAFTYIGCHYVDLVAFITGLRPVEVSLYGIRDRFPNGVEGWLWTDARVIWSNGACLNVQNAIGFPDAAPGTNTQGLTMYCATAERGAWIRHDDQYRGIQYCYTRNPGGPGATLYAEPSTDYFQYVDAGGPGLVPVGYGYRSVAYIVERALELQGLAPEERREKLAAWDRAGVMATPANSSYNEAVIEAARQSLAEGGRPVPVAAA